MFAAFTRYTFEPFIAVDETPPSRVEKIQEMYRRAGSAGERAAAKAALERLGAVVPPPQLPVELQSRSQEPPQVASARWKAIALFLNDPDSQETRQAINAYIALRDKTKRSS